MMFQGRSGKHTAAAAQLDEDDRAEDQPPALHPRIGMLSMLLPVLLSHVLRPEAIPLEAPIYSSMSSSIDTP